MLQTQVLKNRRRPSRRPSDPRAAALTVAALAASLLALHPAQTVPRLEPGFGRQGPATTHRAAARAGTAPAAAGVTQQDDPRRDDPADEESTLPASDAVEAARTLSAPFDRLNRRNAPSSAKTSRSPFSVNSESRRAPPSAHRERARSVPESHARPAASPMPHFTPGGPRNPSRSEREASSTIPRSSERTFESPRARRDSDRRIGGTPSQASGAGRRFSPVGYRGSLITGLNENRASDLFAKERARHPRGPAPRRPAERRGERKRNSSRFSPVLLSRLIGPRALRPPPADLEPPAVPADWNSRRPIRDESGRAIAPAPAGLAVLDGTDPATLSRDRRADAHWDGDEWHDGGVRGLVRDGAWLRLQHDGARWWAFAGGEGNAQLRHDGVWWMKEQGVWFVVHDGQPWAWRPFSDWNSEGLFQPGSGTEMVYSRDFSRVALITPGHGAEVFDAETGEKLTDIPEARMPARRRPKIAAELRSDVFSK